MTTTVQSVKKQKAVITMFQLSAQLTRLRKIIDQRDHRECYMRDYFQPMVEALLLFADRAENLPANFLEYEFAFCQSLLIKNQESVTYYLFNTEDLRTLYKQLLLWRIKRGVDRVEDYYLLTNPPNAMFSITESLESMIDHGRSVSDERLALLIKTMCDEEVEVKERKKARRLIAFARSDMDERELQLFLARYIPEMPALEVSSVLLSLLNNHRFAEAVLLLEYVLEQAQRATFKMAGLVCAICCEIYDAFPDKEALELTDEIKEKIDSYLGKFEEHPPMERFLSWVREKCEVAADSRSHYVQYDQDKWCKPQQAELELMRAFRQLFHLSNGPDSVLRFINECLLQTSLVIPLHKLYLLLPYIDTVEHKAAFVRLLLKSIFSRLEYRARLGYATPVDQLNAGLRDVFGGVLYPLLNECFENTTDDESARVAAAATTELVIHVNSKLYRYADDSVEDTTLNVINAYIAQLLRVLQFLLPHQPLEEVQQLCLPLYQLLLSNELYDEVLDLDMGRFFACLVDPARGEPDIPRGLMKDWVKFQVAQKACWDCKDALFIGRGAAVAMPAWIMMAAQQFLPADRETCYQNYASFVERFERMSQTMPENMREQYSIELPRFLETGYLDFAQLLSVMGAGLWQLLAQHYMSFSALPITRLFDKCRDLHPDAVFCLSQVYQKYRNEVGAEQSVKLWESVLASAGAVSSFFSAELEYKLNQLIAKGMLNAWKAAIYSALDKARTLVEFVEHMECEMYRLLHAFLGIEVGKEQRDAYRSQAPGGAIFMMFKGVMSAYERSFDDKYRAGLFRVLKSMLRMDFGMPAAIGEEVNLLTTEVETHNQALRARVTELGGDADLACAYPETMEFTYHRSEAVSVEVQLFEQYQVTWKYLVQLQQRIVEVLPEEVASDDAFFKNLKSIYDHIQSLSGLIGADHDVESDLSAAQVKQLEGHVAKLSKIVRSANFLRQNHQQALVEHEHVGEFIDHTLAAKERLDELLSKMTQAHEQRLAEEESAEEKKEEGKKRKKKSPSKYAGMKSFQVEFLRKDDPAFLYVGDEVSCCLAPDSFEFRGIVERRMDAGMTIPVVRDKATGKIVALVWLYLSERIVEEENRFVVVVNFQEIATDYLNDPHARDAIISALLHYVSEFYVQDIGASGLVLTKMTYGPIRNHEHLESCNHFRPKKLGGYMTFGGADTCAYYLESLKERGFFKYDALVDIHYTDKVHALIAACDEGSDLSEVVPQALQYVRDQVGHYYSAAPEQQGRLDSLLARAQSEAEQLVEIFLFERQEIADKEAVSAKAAREVGVCAGGGVAALSEAREVGAGCGFGKC